MAPEATGLTVAAYLASQPSLTDLPTPLLTLDAGRLAHNAAAMAAWCTAHDVDLCPHGKTTMAPALWLTQLRAGAWGITVANEFQLRVARAAGVPRVHVANAMLRAGGVRWLAGELAADPGFEVSSWVDSVEAVRLMSTALVDPVETASGPGVPAGPRRTADAGPGGERAPRRLAVCVELGAPGGRTGARSVSAALEVATAVRAAPGLRLVGVAGYEGAVVHAGEPAVPAVDRYLAAVAELHRQLTDRYETAPDEPAIVTVGGSAWFDRVVEILGPLADPSGERGRPTRVVLRSGAYLVHDDVHYRDLTPSVRSAGPELRSAMHGWARVLSRPESGLAILDAGRRDLPFDQDLPVPQVTRRPGVPAPEPAAVLPVDPERPPVGWPGSTVESEVSPVDPARRRVGPAAAADGGAAPPEAAGTHRAPPDQLVAVTGARVTALDDQHAYVALPPGADLAVGDVVRLGLSHPCTAFDKWSLVPVVDDVDAINPRVVGLVRTFF